MALKTNATLEFSSYTVLDTGIEMTFTCPNPGPGEYSHYVILLTDAELATVTTQVQLRTLVTSKLQRRYRATGIASKLDQFIGQTLTV